MKLKRKNSQGIWESVAPSQKEFDTFKTESTLQLADKVGGENKATMNDLGQDVKEAMTGGSVAVVGVGAVGTDNVQSKSITPEKTTIFQKSSNLYNHAGAKANKSIDLAGVELVEAGRSLGGRIEITPETVYSKTPEPSLRIAYSDAKNVFISRPSVNAGAVSFTTPANAYYMQVIPLTTASETLMINKGASLLPFESYGFTLVSTSLTPIKFSEELTVQGKSAYQVWLDKGNVGTEAEFLFSLKGSDGEKGTDGESANSKVNYYRVNARGDFTFFLDIGDGEYASHRFLKDPIEDFVKMYENSIQTKTSGSATISKSGNYDAVTGGTMLATTTNNHYTQSVGLKVVKEFTGTEISVNLFTRYDGGMWRASIDGIFIKNISAWSPAVVSIVPVLIAQGLTNSTHTLVLEYVGEDPANPPKTAAGGATTARGWIKHNTTGVESDSTFIFSATEENALAFTKKFDMTSGFSNKEHAFEVKPAGSTTPTEWFPAHSGIPTTNIGNTGTQNLYVDGLEVDITKASGYILFNSADFIQVMECKMSTDTEARAILKLVMSIKDAKVHQNFEMEFLKETHVSNAYVFQMPLLPGFVGQVKTGEYEKEEANADLYGTSHYFEKPDISSAIATSNFQGKQDYYIKIEIEDKSDPFKQLQMQHRADGTVHKLYPKPYSQEVLPVGKIAHFEGFYEVGRFPKANLIYG